MNFKKPSPLVSIVLPVYNGKNFLKTAVDSVLGQTYKNWELVIVDDCSTDGSSELIADYLKKEDRVKVITNHTNLGLPTSLNKGFAYSKGDYLTWTSDDNIFLPRFLESMLNHLEKQKDVDFVYSDYYAINDKGERLGLVRHDNPKYLPARNVVGAAFLYSREVLDCVGLYDKQMVLVEDYDYWLRVYRDFNMLYIPETQYEYRFHTESLTQSQKDQVKKQKLLLRSKYQGKFSVSLRVKGLSWIYDWYLNKSNLKAILKASLGIFLSGDLAVKEYSKNRIKKA